EATDDRTGDAQKNGHDDTARILPRHDELRDRTRNPADDDPPQDRHAILHGRVNRSPGPAYSARARAVPCQSLDTGPRRRLISERRFLACSRRSFSAFGGRVFRRGFGTCSASASNSTKRSTTTSRFWCWLRLPLSASSSCPSELIRLPSLSSTRARCCSVRLGEPTTSHTSSTRV